MARLRGRRTDWRPDGLPCGAAARYHGGGGGVRPGPAAARGREDSILGVLLFPGCLPEILLQGESESGFFRLHELHE